MDVFISWSSSVTRKIAGAFSEFLELVIHRSKPWYSDETPAGAQWSPLISERLGKSKVGVTFVTQANKESPWLMFEAGAVAKGVPDNRVCVVLVDLKNEDIQPPLSQFLTTPLDEEGIFRVLQTINEALDEDKFNDEMLRRVMKAHWAEFDAKVKQICADEPSTPDEPRAERDMIVEILQTVRVLDQQMRAATEAVTPLSALAKPLPPGILAQVLSRKGQFALSDGLGTLSGNYISNDSIVGSAGIDTTTVE
ncbi:hypothetical protein BC1002_0139 [Paraburkholderia atlantica]|uniref:Uncharacterized protein n=1 Tax=Paraburkholderia atlantica TaxID=2654982 RepID=D5WA25_PARAM|nr:TIR domain-containing protein [Paraburkholderia atlantica]ADG14247.1 hypothetical protein BC1002_0139 [Paraburkholderia atlantica]